MKKALIVIIVLLVIAFGGYLYFDKVLLGNNKVFTYGKSYTIEEILNKEEVNNEEVKEYKYRRAIVKAEGSTTHREVMIDDDKIVFIGNRDLVKINGKLYVYE